MPARDDYSLVPMEAAHKDLVREWRNSDRVRAGMYTDHTIAREEHEQWSSRVLADPSVDYRVPCYRGRPIGLVAITNIDLVNSKCFWGFYVGEPTAPVGAGAAMEYLALQYMFEARGTRKVCCEVLSSNEPVIRLHSKFGFREEGRFLQHVLKGGRYQDVVFLAMLAIEWRDREATMGLKIFR
jgi:UDP-4-amino-4,6-dideoxy-N-acetyl-beta-L-altrosamine N-acetyltransferase